MALLFTKEVFLVIGRKLAPWCVSSRTGKKFKHLQSHAITFVDKFDFAITEIDNRNQRSLNAHKRIGFREIHRYNSADKTEWVIVVWDWKAP